MIPQAQIEQAKRADLPTILLKLGFRLVPDGKGYCLLEHDSLKFFRQKGIWCYKWYSRNGEVGDGIYFLQRHAGMSFKEAVNLLAQIRALSGGGNRQFSTKERCNAR